ncbi:MAG TPA: cation diffusion facilitator family transporter, partial [Afifellaceae bacterium]|nr:cation diffusion facilitator family transporter [Afifellaceae bacterium]
MTAGHAHAEAGRADRGASHRADKRRVLLAAALTTVLMVAEAVGGLLTGSLALLADAAHMLTDSVALALAWLAFHISERPATQRLTFGFDRIQAVAAYTNGLTIILLAIWIVVEAIVRLRTPAPVLAGPMLAVAVAGLAVNVAAFLVLHGGDRASLNLRGALIHVLGDLLGSIAAIAAALIILATGWTSADPLLSLLVAAILVRSGWTLVRDSGLVLLEGVPMHIDRNDVARDLERAVPGLDEVHHMHIWSLDGRRMLATLHARLGGSAAAGTAVAAIKERL